MHFFEINKVPMTIDHDNNQDKVNDCDKWNEIQKMKTITGQSMGQHPDQGNRYRQRWGKTLWHRPINLYHEISNPRKDPSQQAGKAN